MILNPEFHPPEPPKLDYGALPANEQEAAKAIAFNLNGLAEFARKLAEACALSQFCMDKATPGTLYHAWLFVGARDGAMSLYHIVKVMTAVRALFHRCPTWKAAVDHFALRQSVRDFEKQFPFAVPMRHALAHTAELRSTPEKLQLNKLTDRFVSPISTSRRAFSSERTSTRCDITRPSRGSRSTMTSRLRAWTR